MTTAAVTDPCEGCANLISGRKVRNRWCNCAVRPMNTADSCPYRKEAANQ